MELVVKILNFMLDSFLHIWPYLVITIPVAVAVKLSGASNFLNRLIGLNPIVAIILATVVGAFSPFCSCGVIPVIASLLTGGVPLAPVMSFWIASPSMDPEIFFLSASVIGIKMSVWRLVATFAISLSAGLLTHLAVKRGWLDMQDILITEQQKPGRPIIPDWDKITRNLKRIFVRPYGTRKSISLLIVDDSLVSSDCCVCVEGCIPQSRSTKTNCCEGTTTCCAENEIVLPFRKRLIAETWKALFMTTKFMALAFLINALIKYCLPPNLFDGILAKNGPFAVVIAALIGIPMYTSNITVLPIVSGLMAVGMNPGAALAFLIAGPVTTLPAMSAVWGLVSRKVFLLYLLVPFAGALLFGWLYTIFQ